MDKHLGRAHCSFSDTHKHPLSHRVGIINRHGLNGREREVISHIARGEGGPHAGNEVRSRILYQSYRRPVAGGGDVCVGYLDLICFLCSPYLPKASREKFHQLRGPRGPFQELGSGPGLTEGQEWVEEHRAPIAGPPYAQGRCLRGYR